MNARLRFQAWALRRGHPPRRAAFWHLGGERLIAAVFERHRDEPLLLRCAATPPLVDVGEAVHAPGVAELASHLQCFSLVHVAALEEPYARLRRLCLAEAGAVYDPPALTAPAYDLGAKALVDTAVVADRETVSAVRCTFERAGLRLAALDAGVCARTTLAHVLSSEANTLDPLSACSVVGDAERDAVALGTALAVPVGLAVAWMGGEAFAESADDAL